MINMEQIMELMNQGMSADQIAQDFTSQLNAAIQKKKEQEEAKKVDAEKIAEANKILTLVFDFGEKYYPEIFDKKARGVIDAAGLVEAMDQARDEVMHMRPHMDALFAELERLHPALKEGKMKAVKISTGDPIADFLKSQNLI